MLRTAPAHRFALALALIGGASMACHPGGSKVNPAPTVRKVRTSAAELDTSGRTIQVTGVGQAVHRASLSFTVGGRLAELPIGVGDRVEAGQVVARLDERPFEHHLLAARARSRQTHARAGQARRDHRRARQLASAGAFATAELEAAGSIRRELGATVAGTQVDIREAQRRLDEATLVAPFDAVVSAVGCQPEEFAVPGQPIVTLNGVDGMEVQVELPEAALSQIHRGDSVAVGLPLAHIDGLRGVVHTVGEAATPGGLFPVVIRLDDAMTVRPGATVEVELTLHVPPRLTVPTSAIVRRPGSPPHILRIEDGRVHRVDVDVATLEGHRVAVTGELTTGDVIVAEDAYLLLDGEAVEVEA